MNKNELLALIEEASNFNPSAVDTLCAMARKIAALEPMARVTMCGSVGRLEWVAVKGQENPIPGDLCNLTWIIDRE